MEAIRYLEKVIEKKAAANGHSITFIRRGYSEGGVHSVMICEHCWLMGNAYEKPPKGAAYIFGGVLNWGCDKNIVGK